MAVTGILIKDLATKTTLTDDDLVVIGEGSDAKKMTIAKLRELIGIGNAANLQTAEKDIVSAINALNTNQHLLDYDKKQSISITPSPDGDITVNYTAPDDGFIMGSVRSNAERSYLGINLVSPNISLLSVTIPINLCYAPVSIPIVRGKQIQIRLITIKETSLTFIPYK